MESGRIEPLRALPIHTPVGQTYTMYIDFPLDGNTPNCGQRVLKTPGHLWKVLEAPGGCWKALEDSGDPWRPLVH